MPERHGRDKFESNQLGKMINATAVKNKSQVQSPLPLTLIQKISCCIVRYDP